MARTYLYGIIESGNGTALGELGVDGISPVRVVARDGLGCVVSGYKGKEFADLSEQHIIRSLLAHQRVVERVMEYHTVLPVKFGTFFTSSREVQALLLRERASLLRALGSIQDKVEIDVAATWDVGRVLQEISKDEDVVRAREAITAKGQPTLGDRLQLGEMVKGLLDKRREQWQARMVGLLKPLALDVTPNVLVSDELVMNVAFLVERCRQGEFDERVQCLDGLFQNEITFRVIGPLPPYSFSSVEIARITPAQIEEACHTLELGDVTTEVEIRRAYRRLAAKQRRNWGMGDRLDEGHFARLREALELLVRYCRARGEVRGPEGRDVAAGEAVDGLFVVAVKGTKSEDIEPSRFGAAGRTSYADGS